MGAGIERSRRAATGCRLATAAALVGAVAAGPALAQTQAGVASAVVNEVEVSGPPRPAPVRATNGMDMFLDDRIRTAAEARMQVLLLDETVFTVGPGSDLTIDRFVYDPDAGTGEMAAEMTTGFLRYVSGQIGAVNPENVTVDTPAATIGIRGTALLIAQVPDRAETWFCGVLGPGRANNALARPGGCILRNEFGVTEVRRAGFGAFVTRGQAPGDPERIPDALIAQLHSELRPATRRADATRTIGPLPGQAGGPLGAVQIAGQDVAETRETGLRQFELVTSEYEFLTDSSSTDQIDDRPPSEIVDVIEEVATGTPSAPPVVAVPFFAQLTWEGDLDLDLHATGPVPGTSSRYHVFFAQETAPPGPNGLPLAELGAVSSNIENSEVITVNFLGSGGPTRLSVFNFTDQEFGSTSLADDANALVALLQNGLIRRGPGGTTVIDGTLVDLVEPPAGGAGNTFVAYEIDATGTATRVLEFTDFPNAVAVE
ncbi:MAG: FecR domain-containing protein [Paracoccaceae bacterium]